MTKSQTNYLLITIFCFSLIMGIATIFPVQANATVSSDAKAAYQKKMNNYSSSTKYKIIDIDKNGIPELLVADYMEPTVFTYNKKSGKIKKLMAGFSYDTIYYSTRKHMAVVINHGSGWTWYKFYKISGLKAKKKAIYKYQKVYVQSGGKSKNYWKYTINGKKVSLKKIRSRLKKALKGYKHL